MENENNEQVLCEEPSQKEKVTFKSVMVNIWKYLIKTTNGMAYGLFATLIMGTIISTIASFFPETWIIAGWSFKESFAQLGTVLKSLMGIGIGIGVALTLNLSPLQIISGGVAGAFGSAISKNNPLMAYICAIAGIELTRLILKKKTPVDILLIPFLNCIFAFIVGWILVLPINFLIDGLAQFIDYATMYQPFLMGVVISVLMGMALTAPISSVAIAVAISLQGIAGGAAVVGCSVQMVGFAVMTARDKNGIGKVISVGIGTSMLQFKNILKKPIIWLPTIIVSALLGPLSTCVFKMTSDISGSGMGTCGLVGQIGTINAMGSNLTSWMGIIILHFVAPIILVFLLDLLFRKLKLIKDGDLSLE